MKTTITMRMIIVSLFACSISSASAQDPSKRFLLVSKHNNGCVRVQPAPTGPQGHPPIVAGILRTSGCQKSPDRLIGLGRTIPHFLGFDLGGGEVRCINVRSIDTETLPSDIFANKCTHPTSHWGLDLPDADGFAQMHLFENDSLCLAVGEFNTHIRIDRCLDDDPKQKWELEEVTMR